MSRSGASRYHGMVYGFLTDSRLNARNYFDQTAGSIERFPVPRSSTDATQVRLDGQPLFQPNPVGSENPFTRSQAGFVMGGPLRPQRSHVFASFEHQDLNASRESHFAVPTVSQRGLFESGASGLKTYRFLIGNPVINVYYPTSGFGDAIYSLFPWPNNPLGPYGYNTRTEILPADADGALFSLKVDHRFEAFAKQHTLNGRYNFSDDDSVFPVTGEALYSSVRPRVRTQNLSLILDTLLSNQSSSQMRFSYGRTRLNLDEFPNGLRGEPAFSFQDPLDRQFLLNSTLVYNLTHLTDGLTRSRLRTTTPTNFFKDIDFTLPPVNGTEVCHRPIGGLVMTGFSPLGVDVFNLPQQRTNNTFQYAATLIHNFPGFIGSLLVWTSADPVEQSARPQFPIATGLQRRPESQPAEWHPQPGFGARASALEPYTAKPVLSWRRFRCGGCCHRLLSGAQWTRSVHNYRAPLLAKRLLRRRPRPSQAQFQPYSWTALQFEYSAPRRVRSNRGQL